MTGCRSRSARFGQPAAAAGSRGTAQAGGTNLPAQIPDLQPHQALLEPHRPTRARQHQHAGGICGGAPAALRLAARKRPPMQLKIQYFALMREQAGRSDESAARLPRRRPRRSTQELRARYPFTLALEQLKVAVNSEFSEWSRRLNPGDAVVFIPPVAGG